MNLKTDKVIIGLMVIIILSAVAFAHSAEEFTRAEELIKSKISCSELSNDQLKMIGEYYMEQMHPGELHELMDERMGGEGSAQLRQVHLSIAKSFYCGEGMMNSGMMNLMMGRSTAAGGGMMGFNGMMNNYGYGMMGSWGYGYSTIVIILYLILLIGIIVLVYLGIVKLWRTLQKSPGK